MRLVGHDIQGLIRNIWLAADFGIGLREPSQWFGQTVLF